MIREQCGRKEGVLFKHRWVCWEYINLRSLSRSYREWLSLYQQLPIFLSSRSSIQTPSSCSVPYLGLSAIYSEDMFLGKYSRALRLMLLGIPSIPSLTNLEPMTWHEQQPASGSSVCTRNVFRLVYCNQYLTELPSTISSFSHRVPENSLRLPSTTASLFLSNFLLGLFAVCFTTWAPLGFHKFSVILLEC